MSISEIVTRSWGFLLVVGLSVANAPAFADDTSLTSEATWQWPDVAVYETQLASFLEQTKLSEEQRQSIEQLWKDTTSIDRGPLFLDRLLDITAKADERLASLTSELRAAGGNVVPASELAWLASDVPGWLQDVVRLATGRAFAQRNMYDESLEALSGLRVDQVCDPATLLFYRASAEHHLLKKDECLANVERLLQRSEELPTRYRQVAKLIKADIEPLKEDSLDEISRMMFDVQRRLDLGRAGQRVREREDKIIEKLDKLIEDIEKQMQQQQQQQQQQQNAQQMQQDGLQDSQIAGGTGPGDVDKKDNGNRAGWGNLPPAERQEALQQLTEELPSHYRQVIEGYFRQLAKDRKP